MAPTPRTATAKSKHWSYSTGERRLNRVRVYERQGYGIWIDYRDEGGTRRRHPLGTTDRAEAKAQADEIAAKFRRGTKRQPNQLTLAELIDSYEREVTPSKVPTVQEHDRRTFLLFLRQFGAARRPRDLSRREWDAYIAARRSGRLRPGGKLSGGRRPGVRNRSIEQDLNLLNAMMNWATQVSDGNGGYLLDRNPLKGLPVPHELSPSRALLTFAQYQALRAAAAVRGSRLECFVAMAWHTGHRASSIRRLRWSDVDLEGARIHWRAELDKIGLDHWNPLHSEAVAILRRERSLDLSTADTWIFPATRDPSQPLSGDAIANLWQRIAETAKLPTGQRYGWHSCRRAFANRLRKTPLRDLQDLGGWKTHATLLSVYLRPDEQAQRDALEGAFTPPAAVVAG